MVNQYTAPIDHSAASAGASTLGGGATGAIGGAGRAFWKGIKTLAIIGGIVGLVAATFGTGLIALPAAMGGAGSFVLPGIVSQLFNIAVCGAIGTAIGGALGVAGGYITLPVGGIIGAFKGAKQASQQVTEEQGAARVLQAQVDMARAEALARNAASGPAAAPYQPFPPQGGPMNSAPTRIQIGDNMQYNGSIAGGLGQVKGF